MQRLAGRRSCASPSSASASFGSSGAFYALHSKRIVLFGYPIMGYQLDDAAGGDCTEGVLDPPASRLFHVGWPTGAKK